MLFTCLFYPHDPKSREGHNCYRRGIKRLNTKICIECYSKPPSIIRCKICKPSTVLYHTILELNLQKKFMSILARFTTGYVYWNKLKFVYCQMPNVDPMLNVVRLVSI